MSDEKAIQKGDSWSSLRQYTNARIALGKTGISLPINEVLSFKMAHAHARDAVFSTLNKEILSEELSHLQLPVIRLQSRAANRHIYLQRPDLGRRLDDISVKALSELTTSGYDVCISIADGLSANAVNRHALPVVTLLLEKLSKQQLRIAPLCLIEQGRVAISDETGSLLKARLSLILIGERPGLSSPDSLGAYLTYAPQVGLTDESRNCVSNIRPEGMRYEEAAVKIMYLISEAFRLRMSGIALKDNSTTALENKTTKRI